MQYKLNLESQYKWCAELFTMRSDADRVRVKV